MCNQVNVDWDNSLGNCDEKWIVDALLINMNQLLDTYDYIVLWSQVQRHVSYAIVRPYTRGSIGRDTFSLVGARARVLAEIVESWRRPTSRLIDGEIAIGDLEEAGERATFLSLF